MGRDCGASAPGEITVFVKTIMSVDLWTLWRSGRRHGATVPGHSWVPPLQGVHSRAERPVGAVMTTIGSNLPCPNCGVVTPYGDNYCRLCGNALASIACTKCGRLVGPKDRACGYCGEPTLKPAIGTADTRPSYVDAPPVDGYTASSIKWWFGLDGRINRRGYWLRWVLSIAIYIASALIMAEGSGAAVSAGFGLWIIAAFLNFTSVVRRIHDRGSSGWLLLLLLLPLVNLILLVQIAFLPGDEWSNEYGALPYKSGVGV